jgi:8-oxo-dGTP diphosphatase
MAPDPRVHVGAVAHVTNARSGFVEHLLVCRGPNASHGANTWALPGGWLEFGETPWEAAKRELKEETDIDTAGGPRLPTVGCNTYEEEGLHIVTLCFEVPTWFGSPKLREPDKHAAVEWITTPELQDVPLFPSTWDYFNGHGYVL